MSTHPGISLCSLPDLRLTGRQAKALDGAGIGTLGDLLLRFPRRFEDRSAPTPLPGDLPGHPILVTGTVINAQARRLGRQRCTVLAVALDTSCAASSQALTCRWFGMPYLARGFPHGARVFLFGTPKLLKGEPFMDHPEHEVIRPDDPLQLGQFAPIHSTPRGITTRDYRGLVHHALGLLTSCPDLLPPPKADGPFAGSSRLGALRDMHFPPSQDALTAARRYLALEWLVGQQLGVLARRAAADRQPKKRAPLTRDDKLADRLLANLPFLPTGDQQRAIAEIRRDLRSPRPMNRLLHGDVGSGKTLVAAAAAAIAMERGEQVALMAPTQILAEQHFATLSRWFQPLGIDVSLNTSALRRGTPSAGGLVVGTHALLHSKDEALDPALIVIDEQHKFGVAQREQLIGRARNPPDVLVMTATPIPRTLLITSYGDLDVSTLKEKPAGRTPIATEARYATGIRELSSFLKQEMAKGRQAYLVFPRIDGGEQASSSRGKIPTLEEELPKWEKRLRPYRVGHVHSGVTLEDREATMRDFRDGSIPALLCTTVIEVGVDVPNATVMCIFGAGRFGLAQLHQLRGRIGRGSGASHCLLLPDRDDPEVREKLAILEQTEDGFRIAEADLARRGPGEILGFSQSGHGGLAALSEQLGDPDFCSLGQKVAQKIAGLDPSLEQSANRELIKLSSPGRLGDGTLQ